MAKESLNAEDTLNAILEILQRFERRDRWSRFGSFLRSMIYIGFVVVSTWYLYVYGEDLMVRVSQKAAETAAKFTEERSADLLEKMRNAIPNAGN